MANIKARFILIFLILLIFSCGKVTEDNATGEAEEEFLPDGTYSALLVPINYRISSAFNGDATVIKEGDDFKVRVRVKGAPDARFRQYLQTGSSCPRMDQDTNGDKYIDFYEASRVAGLVLVPLDGDLSSQASGRDFILRGNYRYSRSTSYSLLLSDLHLPDDVVNDSIVKLPERELPLERRVIVIYRTRGDLPATIAGEEVPIACGVLTRISSRVPRTQRWEEDDVSGDDQGRRSRPRRPRPRAPVPTEEDSESNPDPENEPSDENAGTGGSWWSRWRQRWNDWWSGNEHPEGE